jgi:type II secretory pathway pseudopilin PulG
MAGLLFVLGVACAVIILVAVSQQRLSRRERSELARLRNLVANLREIAYDHRELDSSLAVIILDEIKSSERKDLEP